MASSVEQHWSTQHRVRSSIMDNPAHQNAHQSFPASTQFFSAQEPTEQITYQVQPNGNYFITNVQQQNNNYGSSTAHHSGSVGRSSGNYLGGGNSGPGGFEPADCCAGECGNPLAAGTYDYAGRAPSASGQLSQLQSATEAASSCQAPAAAQQQLVFGQEASTSAPSYAIHQLPYYPGGQTSGSSLDSYYFPAITYPAADYQQSQAQSYGQATPMYAAYGQPIEQLAARGEPLQPEGGQVFAELSSSTAPGAALPEADQAAAVAVSSAGCCSSSSPSTNAGRSRASKQQRQQQSRQQRQQQQQQQQQKQQQQQQQQQQRLQSAALDDANHCPESVALLDSTSNQLESGRKIKAKSATSQQQAEHQISSCHTNRVRAGPLGIIARRKNATRETTAILKEWLDEHGQNPYPSKGEKIMLSCVTKMNMTQVSTWFANARRRMKKEKRSFWAASKEVAAAGGSGCAQGPTSSANKVKSEYAKSVSSSASSSHCPALKYFIRKHHKQMLATSPEHAHLQQQQQQPTYQAGSGKMEDSLLHQAASTAAGPAGAADPSGAALALRRPPLKLESVSPVPGHAPLVGTPTTAEIAAAMREVKIKCEVFSDNETTTTAPPSSSCSSSTIATSSSSLASSSSFSACSAQPDNSTHLGEPRV